MEFFQCIPLKSAQQLVCSSLGKNVVGQETVKLADSLGRIVAADLFAKDNLPAFDRSTVDGFAVYSGDTFGAGEAVPVVLTIAGEVAMGETAAMELSPGQVVAIPTGGMVPAGADAVVMLEYTEQLDSNTLMISRVVAPGENMVKKGEDVCAHNLVVAQGQKIHPQHVGVLAACGHMLVPVYKLLQVAIISTGDELVDISETPQIGQIRDINSYSIGAMLKEAGCTVTYLGIVKDSYEAFLAAVTRAIGISQLVIISGGSSVGARDYTVNVLNALGTPGVLLHGIAIKPGKPTIFGMACGVPVFGLPGHPVAAMTVCEQLVKQAVALLMGKKQLDEKIGVLARLLRNVPSAPGRDDFISIRLKKEESGYTAEPILGKSGLINTIAQADGVLHIPAEKGGLYSGDLAEVFLVRDWR